MTHRDVIGTQGGRRGDSVRAVPIDWSEVGSRHIATGGPAQPGYRHEAGPGGADAPNGA